jgi:hypothetical protein
MALISDDYITIAIGKNTNDPISNAYTTVLSGLYSFLAPGFYLPPGYLVVGPGTNLCFSFKGDANRVKVYTVNIETGEEVLFATVDLGGAVGYITVPYSNVDLPYDLSIKVFRRDSSQETLLSSYIIHVRNYAVPVMVQALEFLLYAYIPLYVWYLFQLKMFPISIESAVEDIIGKVVSLPLEELPLASDIYGLGDVSDLEEYLYPINPFDSFIEDENLSRVLYELLNSCNLSVEEKFKKIFGLSLYYLLYKNSATSTSVMISAKYLLKFLSLVLDLAQMCVYGGTTKLIDGFGITTLPLLFMPQRFMLPFKGSNYNELSVLPVWNLYRVYPGDLTFRPHDSINIPVSNYGGVGRIVIVKPNGSMTYYNNIDTPKSLPSSDNKLFYQLGYKVYNSSWNCMSCAYYFDNEVGSYFVFFQHPFLSLELKDDSKYKAIPKSSQEVEILPLYSTSGGAIDLNNVIGTDVYYVENAGIPFFSFITNSDNSYSILFKNGGSSGEDKGSQFILSSVESSGLRWVIFIHLFLSKQIVDNEGNLLVSEGSVDWKVMNAFLTALSSVVSNYFGMVEIWITPFYKNSSGKYQFHNNLYSYIYNNKLHKPYNTTMFFSIRLEDFVNVWSG